MRCLFDVRNIDLPRKVKYRPRYKKPELKVDQGCRVGRNYHDYEVYMEKYPDMAVIQMDSVIDIYDGKGFRRTRNYYCNPSAPYQKAEIEVGHEFIRRIAPKGKSFDDLAQEDVELMMDHINSYRRKKLNGKSPYEAFCFYYGEYMAESLGDHEVAAKDINLTPGLLKK